MTQESQDRTGEFPRPGSVLFNTLCAGEKAQQKTINQFKRVNKFLTIPLYRLRLLPLLGFGRIFLLLSTRGRKSGKIRRTPLEYRRINGIIHVFASRGAKTDWYRNMRATPSDIHVQLGLRRFRARADFVEDQAELEEIMRYYVKHYPKASKTLFGWNSKLDDPETADLSSLARLLKIVRLSKS
ncbi:MAG: nitroreductase family deazaflavin-dependent oxidoreductase [Candidatus Odinarchaeota archaeon]